MNRAGEPEPGVFGSFGPEPLKKKQEPKLLGRKSGDGAAKKLNWKVKSIRKLYFSYSSLGKIVSFYG